MAGIRRAVRASLRQGFEEMDHAAKLSVALDWLAQPWSEDKLAGVLLIAEHLAPALDDADVTALAHPFQQGHIADWNVCDWMCVKAIHRFVTLADIALDRSRAEAVAAWCDAGSLWQRRAAVVSFVNVAARGEANFAGFSDLLLEACAANIQVADRFAHTGPGWALRELSAAEPARVRGFVDAHPELSPEGRRMALARLTSGPYRRRGPESGGAIGDPNRAATVPLDGVWRMTDDLPVMSFEDGSTLHDWLVLNHRSSSGLWVRVFRSRSGVPSATFDDLLEQGLCFGWSESRRIRGDEISYLQRFTPRRRAGTTSERNRKLAQRLLAEGRMTRAGLEALGMDHEVEPGRHTPM
jgi:3-methyladenine DNA glycosylase AlkD